MASFFQGLFDTAFMPHVYCLRLPSVIWLHVVSDAFIALAYAAIPFALLRLLRLRKDLSFHWMFVLFAVFILSCGATHALGILTLWVPIYRFEGLIKLVTALSSVATAYLLIRVIPQVVSQPSLALGGMGQLADSMPQIVWAASPDGSLDYFNQRLYDYCNTTFEQAKGAGWLQMIHPDDVPSNAQKWTASVTTHQPFETQHRIKRASDGAYRWHMSRALPIRNKSGEVVRWFGTSTDIEDYKLAEAEIKALNEGLEQRVLERTAELAAVNQDLKRAEQRARLLAAIVESSEDAIISETLDGIITSWNNGAEQLFGHTAAEAIGRHISLINPSTGADSEEQLLNRMRKGQMEPLETIRLHKNGQPVQVSLALSPIRDKTGNIIGASKSLRDIGERLRAEKQIKDLNEQLKSLVADAEAANKAKSAFLSTMSHEIRTPLNAILGYAQLMLRDPALTQDAKTNLKIIGRSGEHLLGLINDVLDMSKIEAGRSELHPITFNLARLVNDLAAMFRLRAESKALRFELLVEGECALYVVADEGKIRQALINLLGNAIRFTNRGTVTLHVTVTDKGGDQLWLSACVEDTGSGIAEDEQKKLFEPFTQAKGALNTQEGTGLGLAISRKFARMMGGDITLQSIRGKGSSFCLQIPMQRGDASAAIRANALRRVVRLSPGTEVPQILVADDQFENRDSLMKLLAAVGFSVLGAENGLQAIEHWEQWKPKMILMDVHMPVMDGLEATRKIKADPRGLETLVVVLTASAMEEDRRLIARSGADDFLAKPCLEDDLFESLRTLLNVSYEYEEQDAITGPSPGTDDSSFAALAHLPSPLIQELRQATFNGDKRLLDALILKVSESGTTALASALAELSNNYSYDKLTRLLEEACQ